MAIYHEQISDSLKLHQKTKSAQWISEKVSNKKNMKQCKFILLEVRGESWSIQYMYWHWQYKIMSERDIYGRRVKRHRASSVYWRKRVRRSGSVLRKEWAPWRHCRLQQSQFRPYLHRDDIQVVDVRGQPCAATSTTCPTHSRNEYTLGPSYTYTLFITLYTAYLLITIIIDVLNPSNLHWKRAPNKNKELVEYMYMHG